MAQEAQQNWQAQCFAPDRSTPLTCAASQRLVDGERRAAVLRATVSVAETIDNEANALLTLEVPPGVHIPSGVTLGDQSLSLENCDGRG